MKSFSPLKILFLLCTQLCYFESLYAAKILAIFPFQGRSQYICVENYLKALAARGHEVTVISEFPQKKQVPNFRDVTIINKERLFEDFPLDDFMTTVSKWEELNWGIEYLTAPTRRVLEHPEVQKWLANGVTFDLLIVEVLQQEALYALSYHFNASLIGVSSFGTDMRIDELVGNTSPLSYVPSVLSTNSDHMSFYQRLESLYTNIVEWVHNHFVMIPLQYELYKTHVSKPTADFMAIRKNFSLLLLNQHFSMSIPRPYVTNAIEVGGFHIEHKPKALPADMEAFINANPNGAIFFSLGSNFFSKNLSKEKLAIILNVFASLPYNIFWKFEVPELPGKPENVYINKWFPQADILAHPNVKLFITHGGLLSTIEAIHYAKPIVGIPIFYDQHLNVARAQAKGFGLGVNLKTLNAEEFKDTILEVLNNPKYAQRARELSNRYHDQPLKPLEKAIYWTEYVLRHKGAPHMRVAAQDLNFIEYHNLDAIAVLFGLPLLALVFMVWASCRLWDLITEKLIDQKRKVKQN
ncbi:UDP-glycosyltransferase UGT5 [Bactrocera dorsalis]|uniref:UDP-glucuronosyltransferase n=1 Tax=Bactrocera dorsalis TaxID=27457 RepID=A0A6J0RJD6_BACDO|nr:UDP-glycosyltransferase UGT5 [Bactrocera dorsalis]